VFGVWAPGECAKLTYFGLYAAAPRPGVGRDRGQQRRVDRRRQDMGLVPQVFDEAR
jgi:hypothetical protein